MDLNQKIKFENNSIFDFITALDVVEHFGCILIVLLTKA